MNKQEYTIGPITGTDRTKTGARVVTEHLVTTALNDLDKARPVLVVWNGEASMCYPVIMANGKIEWMYTNPRPIAVLAADLGRHTMGTAGYYESASLAASAALCHLIQSDPNGIPEELPTALCPKDAQNLQSIRVGLCNLAAPVTA